MFEDINLLEEQFCESWRLDSPYEFGVELYPCVLFAFIEDVDFDLGEIDAFANTFPSRARKEEPRLCELSWRTYVRLKGLEV